MDRQVFYDMLSQAHPRSFTKFDPTILPKLRDEFEAALIRLALERVPRERTGPNRKAASRLLDLSRNTLSLYLKTLKIKVPE